MNTVSKITPSDESLMKDLSDGDDLALNALMSRWETKLVSFAMRYTNNHSVAVDLAEETFVKVYENRGRFRPTGKFSTWMFTITVNLCRNHARWKSRHPSVTIGAETDGEKVNDWGGDIVDSKERPDNSAIRSEEATQVRTAVQGLPHDLRTAIILFEFEGMSHAEIAATQACTPKAVETRLYRARQILREKLEGILSPKNDWP